MQKQIFNKEKHNKFIKYFGIKENPSEIEKTFYEKTEKYLNYIKWIPGLKLVGIGNSISMNCANEKSDIDLFIITEKKRIWTVRILITLIFYIFRVRKDKYNHAGRFCLSFFATTTGMNFKNFVLENDIYLYFWIIYLKPILDYDNTYQKFLEANESWCTFGWYENILVNNKKHIQISNNKIIMTKKKFSYLEYIFKKSLKIPGDILELFLNFIFSYKSKNTYKNLGKPFGIIINHNILKFHNDDIRKKIKKNIL